MNVAFRLALCIFISGCAIGGGIILILADALNSSYLLVTLFLLAILVSNLLAKMVQYALELAPIQV